MRHGITRRRFLQAGAALLAGPAPSACLHGPTVPEGFEPGDPRLTARPGTPSEPAVVGETPLGLGTDRDGLLYVPASYDPDVPAPLLVGLHGATGAASNWSGFYTACENRGMVLLAVDSRLRTWDRILANFGDDVGFIDQALAHAFDRVRVDPDRIGLAGFSDGASYSISLGVSNGDVFSHLIAFSPGMFAPSDPLVGEPAVWISHGRQDVVLRETTTRVRIVPALEALGYEVEYTAFDGGHEVPPEIGGAALDWFTG